MSLKYGQMIDTILDLRLKRSKGKMIGYEDECVGCPPEMGCLGSICPNLKVTHYYCDRCDDETQLYEFEGEQLCLSCIEELLIKVN